MGTICISNFYFENFKNLFPAEETFQLARTKPRLSKFSKKAINLDDRLLEHILMYEIEKLQYRSDLWIPGLTFATQNAIFYLLLLTRLNIYLNAACSIFSFIPAIFGFRYFQSKKVDKKIMEVENQDPTTPYCAIESLIRLSERYDFFFEKQTQDVPLDYRTFFLKWRLKNIFK